VKVINYDAIWRIIIMQNSKVIDLFNGFIKLLESSNDDTMKVYSSKEKGDREGFDKNRIMGNPFIRDFFDKRKNDGRKTKDFLT